MFKKIATTFALLGGILSAPAHAELVVTASTDASSLTNQIVGEGINIVGTPTLTTASDTAAGAFSGGGTENSGIGIDKGVLLTTGTVDCAPGPNNNGSCTGTSNGTPTSLAFSFTSDTGWVYVTYVFASEEYPIFVGKGYSDKFSLLLNGTNIATLPGTNIVVSIDTVNSTTNSEYYRDNASNTYDTQYNGMTTVLTVGVQVSSGVNDFDFLIVDSGDQFWDSAVFIGYFGACDPSTGCTPPSDQVPEPASLALVGLGLAALAAARRRKEV